MRGFQQLFQHSSDAVFGTNHSGEIIYWNRTCEKLLGWTSKDVYGAPCCQVLDGHNLIGEPFCNPDCPIRKKQPSKQITGDFDLIIKGRQNGSIWVNVGICHVPSGSRVEAQGVSIFFSMRYINCQRLLQRLVNETHNHNTRVKTLGRLYLTTREIEVLSLASQGQSSQQISEQLHICLATIKNHFRRIYSKLKVRNRAEAITVAFQHDILPPVN